MEDLLVKYIDDISKFKNRIEAKYHQHDIKKVEFSIKSNYTNLGEILKVESEFGDIMSIFEEDDPIILYHEKEIKPSQKIIVQLQQNEKFEEFFEAEVFKDDNGYFVKTYYDNNKKYFNNLDDLFNYYFDKQMFYELFVFKNEKNKRSFTILEKNEVN